MKCISLFSVLIMLAGCQLLPRSLDPKAAECVSPQDNIASLPCDLPAWLHYWLEVSQLSWSERQKHLKLLGDSERDRLQGIFLSQGVDSPYQARLRAHYWAQDYVQDNQNPLADLLTLLVIKPNFQRLELESAVSSLSKLNAQQQEQILALQQQLEKLLQIEQQLIERSHAAKP